MSRILIYIFILAFPILFPLTLEAFQSENEVTFSNKDITLSGTLYLPEGSGPFPAVIFVHGSGAETRENSAYSAGWFQSIGYAALIYDKRGTGRSDGSPVSVNYFDLNDLAGDVQAGLDLLDSHADINNNRIGIHAGSQGGWVAALALSMSDVPDFLMMRSTSFTTIEEDRIFERRERLKSEGFSGTALSEVEKMQRVEAKLDPDPEAPDEFTRLFEEYKSRKWMSSVYPVESPFSDLAVSYRLWYATHYDFDPIPYFQGSDAPVFWIFGDPELDKSGPVELSIKNVNRLKANGKNYEYIRVDDQGHNVGESTYEKQLYNWLKGLHGESVRPFVSHQDQ